jgi:membrane-associated phospholipid phosphatase
VLNTAIKLVFRRRRPQLDGLPPLAGTPTKLSFPSAHTATAFAGAFSYSRLGLPAGPLYGLAVVTAVSRPYLGLHYPSDVIAGAALGIAVAAALEIAANRGEDADGAAADTVVDSQGPVFAADGSAGHGGIG